MKGFAAGTKIQMADGSKMNIEDIHIEDILEEGDEVVEIHASKDSKYYLYKGVRVGGDTQVKERRKWIPVCDSIYATEINEAIVLHHVSNKYGSVLINKIKFKDY